MPLTEREFKTMRLYDATARTWLDFSVGPDRPSYWQAEMDMFSSLLHRGRVVEIGSGPATDGKYLIKKGFDVVSIDYSSGMLDLAKELGTNDKLAQADMMHLPFGNDSFDGFWATASLLHTENVESALAEIFRVTKRNGIGFVSVKEGRGDTIDPKTGYYFHYFGGDEFRFLLEKNKMEVIAGQRRTGSPNHDWLTYLIRILK